MTMKRRATDPLERRTRMHAWGLGLAALMAGCGEDLTQPILPDAESPNDVPIVEDASDGFIEETTPDAGPMTNDVVTVMDAVPEDRGTALMDATQDRGSAPVDVPFDRGGGPMDVAVDRGVAPVDVVTDRGAAVVDQSAADVPRDAGSPAVDSPRPDVVVVPDAGGCAGAAPVVTINAPTTNEEIETCSASGAAVFYNFTANVTAGAALRSVSGQWRTPAGTLAPPNYPPLTAAPFAWRRQVGGPMTDVPPLAVFPEALRGTWQFEVTALDACGRMTTATRAFTLTYTMRRCPNP